MENEEILYEPKAIIHIWDKFQIIETNWEDTKPSLVQSEEAKGKMEDIFCTVNKQYTDLDTAMKTLFANTKTAIGKTNEVFVETDKKIGAQIQHNIGE